MLANSPLILIISSTVLLCSALTAAFLQISMLFFFLFIIISELKVATVISRLTSLTFVWLTTSLLLADMYICVYLVLVLTARQSWHFFFDLMYCHSIITNSLCTSARCCIYTAYFPALVEYFQCQWMINRQSWRTRPIYNCTLIKLDM